MNRETKITEKQKELLGYCDSYHGFEAIGGRMKRTARILESKGLVRIEVNELNQLRVYSVKSKHI